MSRKDTGDLAFWELDAGRLRLAAADEWKPGDPIVYVRREIPEFSVPDFRGERYEALVPDTLDLQQRAELAVGALTGPTDPLADFEIYFFAYFLANPPMMQHSFDYHCTNKFMEALPLMRIVSGSRQNEEVDRRWMEVAVRQQAEDGLMYVPIQGRPWAYLGMEKSLPERAWNLTQFISPVHCGRLLSALTLYHLRDPASVWRQVAERLVDGLSDLAVDRERYAYFSPHCYWAEKGSTDDPAAVSRHAGLEVRGALLGLVHVYRSTGYEPAIRLAGKLARYMLEVCGGFGRDGRFAASLGAESVSGPMQAKHFHLHSYSLQAVLEYALAVGDDALVELADKGYAYGKSCGQTLLGYFPEFVESERLEHSETCEVADMIALGAKLSEAGVGDYWDDVDRWVRNMFAEAQLTHTDWIDRLHTAGWGETREMDLLSSRVDERYQTTDRVAERNRGAFAGWPKANDWYSGQGIGIMHCCTGNAARALYYVWDRILTHRDGSVRVNLLLNRASPWADVDSHIPYAGRVDVRVKQPVDLSVRIPAWVRPSEVCVAGTRRRSVAWDGRYAVVGAVQPGDVVSLTFPIAERSEDVYVEKQRYTVVVRGSDVVCMEPAGKYFPLYQRRHLREATRWRYAERFVSEEAIHW